MTASHRHDPLAVYLVEEDATIIEVTGIVDFLLVEDGPDAESDRQPTRRRRGGRRRRPRGDLALTLAYDPTRHPHRALLEACREDRPLTLHVAERDDRGAAVVVHEVDCAALRYNIYQRSGPRRPQFGPIGSDGPGPAGLRAVIRFRIDGDVRDITQWL